MKIPVICHTHAKRVGSLSAVLGMVTNQGVVVKINEKSVTVEKSWGDQEEVSTACVYYEEAIKLGFPRVKTHDEEMKAAVEWLFVKGEILWEEAGERVSAKALTDSTVRAGYEFARSVGLAKTA